MPWTRAFWRKTVMRIRIGIHYGGSYGLDIKHILSVYSYICCDMSILKIDSVFSDVEVVQLAVPSW